MSARLLTSIGAGLAARGEGVTFVCCRDSTAEGEVARRFPDVARRTLAGRGNVARVLGLRRVVDALRPAAVLVHTEADMLTASLALGGRGGVVRRLAIGERFTRSWRARLAASRSACLLMGDEIGPQVHTDTHVRAAIGWPRVGVQGPGEMPLRLAPAAPPPVLAIVAGTTTPPAQHAAGAAAVRAASRLTTRHSTLRVLLLGAPPELQSMRVHAGSVGLADRLTIIPLDALITPGPFDAAAVWVTAQGDEGAVSIVSAMMRRIPVIVPRGFDTEALVAPRITGFVADDGDLAGSVAALAHVLVDANEHHAMGAAAAARAARLHNWDASLDRTLEALARVSGSRTSRPDAA